MSSLMYTTFVLTRVLDSLTCAVCSCAVHLSAFSSDLCTCNRLMILTRTPHEQPKTKSAQDTLQTDPHVPLLHMVAEQVLRLRNSSQKPESLGSGVPRLETHEYGAIVLASSAMWRTEGVAAPVVELTVGPVWKRTRFPCVNRSSRRIAMGVYGVRSCVYRDPPPAPRRARCRSITAPLWWLDEQWVNFFDLPGRQASPSSTGR